MGSRTVQWCDRCGAEGRELVTYAWGTLAFGVGPEAATKEKEVCLPCRLALDRLIDGEFPYAGPPETWPKAKVTETTNHA